MKRPYLLPALLVMALAIALPVATADDQADRDAFLKEQRAKTKELMKQLESMRGDQFTGEVGVEVMSPDQFRAYLNEQLDKEMPEAESIAMQKTWARLGVIEKDYDLRKGMVDTMASQAAAFYDPEKKTFYILMADVGPQLEPIMLHELEHALQDQLFDLATMMKEASESKNDDRATAVRFIVEGEASYLMTVFATRQQGMDIERLGGMARRMLEMQANMSKDQMLQMQRMQGGMGGGDMAKAAEALKGIPNFIYRMLVDPYNRGQLTIFDVKQAGGWDAVNELFKNPPLSTEMVLHPEKLSGPEQDLPTEIALPNLVATLGDEWKKLHENTLGEHGMISLFEELLAKKGAAPKNDNPLQALLGGGKKSAGVEAAAGWDGDRYVTFEGPEGQVLLAWRSTWDSEKDAAEFAAAYEKVIRNKLAGGEAIDGEGFTWKSADGFARVIAQGADVVVIEGAVTAGQATALEKSLLEGSTARPQTQTEKKAPAAPEAKPEKPEKAKKAF